MIGTDFIFDGIRLSTYKCVMCKPDTESQLPSRAIEQSETTILNPEINSYGVKYENGLILQFFIIKDPCEYENQTDRKFTSEFLNEILTWLESPHYVSDLIVENLNSDIQSIRFNGVFTNIEPFLINGECYGLEISFTCTLPYGLTDIKQEAILMENKTSVSTSIYNNSAEKYLFAFPVIEITSTDKFHGEKLTIHNDTIDSTMELLLPSQSSKIFIDTKKKTIVDENNILIELNDLIATEIDNSFDMLSVSKWVHNWFKLVHGYNSLLITAESGHSISNIVFKLQEAIRVGGI